LQQDKDTQFNRLDLWTATEQEADIAENGHASSLRNTRRLSEHAQVSLLRDWLLQDYAAAYCRSLAATRIFRRCYWIDAFGCDPKALHAPAQDVERVPAAPAGKGRKKNKEQPVPPILAPVVMLSQTLAQESKPINLYGLLLAAGSSKRKELRVTQNGTMDHTITVPKESGIISASWLEAAPLLLKEIEQAPAIFLLNPFGATMFSYDDLVAPCQRAVPTELCLLIPHKQIEGRLRAAQRIPEQASALTTLLRTDRWKTLPTDEESRVSATSGFTEFVIAALQRHFQLPVQPITFSIQTGPARIEPAPYTLIFATRRHDSLVSMNDALCCYHRRNEAQSYQGVLGEEWFLAQQHERLEQARQRLSERALQQGLAQRARRWPDLRQQLLTAQFGQFTQQDYDSVIQQLLQRGAVRCAWRQPATGEDGPRLPGPEDTLLWT
jgi:hypothetical protein